MASVDFSKLSPEEVAALSPAEKKKYDKWFAKQTPPTDSVEPDEVDEVLILAQKEFNTTLYGSFKAGQKGKCLRKLAEQLAEQGLCEIIEEED